MINNYLIQKLGKSILQVPDTGTRVLDNTRPFLRSSIVSFWITPTGSKEGKYHIFRQYWYTKNVPVFTNTGTFQYLGPEVYFFQKLSLISVLWIVTYKTGLAAIILNLPLSEIPELSNLKIICLTHQNEKKKKKKKNYLSNLLIRRINKFWHKIFYSENIILILVTSVCNSVCNSGCPFTRDNQNMRWTT